MSRTSSRAPGAHVGGRATPRKAAALAATVALLVSAGLAAESPAALAAGTKASPAVISLRQEVASAKARFAVNIRARHAGRPEQLRHPARDVLGAAHAGRETAPAGVQQLGMTPDTELTGPTGVLGVDVASYQGNVGWTTVDAGGGQFSMAKATEGTYYYDSEYFPEQYDGSYNAGLVRGAYHFAVPDNSTGAAQADFFVANGGGWTADGKTLPGMLDMEYNPYGAECYGLSQSQMASWVESFDNEYKSLTGRYPILYTSADWWNTCTGGSAVADQDPLDVAAWGPSPSPLPGGWSDWTIWQYTDANALGMDGDAFNGNSGQLVDFARNQTGGPNTSDTLGAGADLQPSQEIISNNGEYKVVMQRDGNLVEYVIAGNRALWSSGTFNHSGAYLAMQTNGDLVVYLGSKALWSTHTTGKGLSRAVIQDDANFVVYNEHNTATWADAAYKKV